MRLTRPFHIAFHVVIAVLMCTALACTSTSLTGPDQSAPKCQVGVTAPQNAIAPNGGSGTITIVAAPECQWVATSPEPWITSLTPASGQGPSQVSFSVGANPAAATRQGDISVNGSVARVNQDPAPCTFEVTPRTVTVASTTGTGTVTVTTPIGCTWTSASEASWLTVTSPAQRTSAGPVTFDYAENLVALPRIGSLTIAGLSVLVTQQAPGCTYVLTPATQNVVVGGAPGAIAVTAGQGCAWTASSNVPWLTVIGSPSGSGVGVVNFSAATNTGSPRTGQITVAGTVATITQDGVASCQFSINPNSQAIGAGGGSGSTALTATPGCSWSVSSNVPWIALTSPSTGTGSSTATFSVGANSGAARQGTLAVAGQTYTVNQSAAACNFNVSPLSQSVGNVAGPASPVGVTTASHCGWTATVNPADTWVRIVGGASGTGNGAVSINLDAHTGTSTRQGRLTIANQAVTINQTGCSFSAAPTSVSVGSLGGAVSSAITVTTQPGCAWTAVVNPADSWIQTPSPSSGTGPGTVQLSADSNLTLGGRTGTVTIATTSVTVSQSALVCSYAITTSSPFSVGAAGGGGSFNVATTPNLPICTWTATASDPTWVTITSGSGAGNGTVSFNVASNTAGARSGSITVPGATPFILNQDAFVPPPCVLMLTPMSTNFTSAGGTGSYAVTGTVSSCSWTATATDPSWVTITAGSGSGLSGNIDFTVAANGGGARSTTITIPGQPSFTVTQDAFVAPPCSLSINPTSANFTNAGGTGSYAVTGNVSSCSWTATATDPSWVTITAGSGSGLSGNIDFTVAANGGVARSTTITIPSQPSFSVTQDAAACSYTLAPTGRTGVLAAGESATVIVTANLPSCGPWTAVSNDAWLTVDSGSPGTGSGSVAYTIMPNGTMAQRTGSLTIAGQAFSVTQEP